MISLLTEKKVHIIGIGGIGMSAIAEILINLGCKVSGSDINSNLNTKKLEGMGSKISFGHNSSNVTDIDFVVYSSAVSIDNPEIVSALKRNIPVLKRSEVLADIMRLKNGIAIAGTHGKTTTTSLVATILKSANLDPTYLIGGIVKNLSGHAHVGGGDLFVVEADESDGTFLNLKPVISGITNVDFDHLDFYGDEKNLIRAFEKFSALVPFYGKIFFNLDDPFSKIISNICQKPFGSYSVERSDSSINFSIENLIERLGMTSFDLLHFGKKVGNVDVRLNGIHNIQNCLLSIAISYEAGVSFEDIILGLKKFEGVGRRLEVLTENENGLIIDDYGHHPTEVFSTINAVSKLKMEKKVTVIFEPHRYTRTHNCWSEFTKSFGAADRVILLPIYSAGEDPISGVTSERLCKELQDSGVDSSFEMSLDEAFDGIDFSNNIILTMGAGKIGRDVRKRLGLDY